MVIRVVPGMFGFVHLIVHWFHEPGCFAVKNFLLVRRQTRIERLGSLGSLEHFGITLGFMRVH